MIRPSDFNLYLEPESTCNTRVYNTGSRKQLSLTQPWEQVLTAAAVDQDIANHLIHEGFLTDTPDYKAECRRHLEAFARNGRSRITLCYTVTTGCSLRCSYCFQAGYPRETTTRHSIERFTDLLEHYIAEQRGLKEIDLVLFGGDPALASDLSLEILKRTAKLCAGNNIRLFTIMTTNGLYFSPVQDLKEYGLNEIMISFDGNKTVHNQTRKDTFDTIIRNLPRFANHFSLVLKYNLHKANADIAIYENFLDALLDELSPNQFVVALEALHPTHHITESELFYHHSSIECAEKFIELHGLSKRKGVPCNIDNALHPPCPGTRGSTITIQPNGELVTCSAAAGLADFRCGNIHTQETLSSELDSCHHAIMQAAGGWCTTTRCAYFPVCETGCPLEKKRMDLSPSEPLCRKDYIEKLVPYLWT